MFPVPEAQPLLAALFSKSQTQPPARGVEYLSFGRMSPDGVWKNPQAGMSNLQPAGHRRPRMAMNVAQHEIINLLKTFFFL